MGLAVWAAIIAHRQIVCETLSQKNLHKNKAGGVVQGEGPEFKPQYCKNKTKQNKTNKQKTVMLKVFLSLHCLCTMFFAHGTLKKRTSSPVSSWKPQFLKCDRPCGLPLI
jgi:hypothetical protein